MFNPFANFQDTMQQFQQFNSAFTGNPQERVQQLLNSGEMSQDQLNQIMPMAQKFYEMMYGRNNGAKH